MPLHRILATLATLLALLVALPAAAAGRLVVTTGPFAFDRYDDTTFRPARIRIKVTSTEGAIPFAVTGLPAGLAIDRTTATATPAGVTLTLTADNALPRRLGTVSGHLAITPTATGKGPAASRQVLLRTFGSRTRGRTLFESRCQGCHQPNGAGSAPLLFAVFGRKAASLKTFAYSQALTDWGRTWNYPLLVSWLRDPQALVPGARMGTSVVVGLGERQRYDIVAYLRSISEGGQ